MSKEILINVEPQQKRVAIVNDGRLEEFYLEHPQDKTIVGNIYKGRIEAVLPNIGAAFVDIGLPKKGFLYLSDIESAFESLESQGLPQPKEVNPVRNTKGEMLNKISNGVKKGQEVLVQVVKESFGTKGPRLSCNIGLAGRYLVIMPQHNQIGISRRIEDEEERRRLKAVLSELRLPKDIGFIVRTAAEGKSRQELLRDAHFLLKLWKRLEKVSSLKKPPALIYEEYDLTFRAIRDSFTDDVSKLIVDSKSEYYRIMRFMKTFLSYLIKRVELYKGDDLFIDKDIERQINKLFESTVYLKSKAYLVIEPTEGLVVIDVNSGGFRKNLDQEEAAFKVNCETAIEVGRQIKLRDLGGIIVIDFIDMEKEGHRREVLNILKKALSNDKAKYDILGISKFGLVEMTRERIHKTAHMVSYQACPYCSGRGKVKSPLTVSTLAIKELRRFLRQRRPRQASISLHPLIVDEILKDKNTIRMIEQQFKAKINLIASPSSHIEEIKISP